MNKELVSLRFLAILVIMLFAVQITDCNAQRNATRRFEKETFGKSRRSSPMREGGESRAAEKAIREQAKKEARREKEDKKHLKELRKQHYEIQSEGTRMRMENNSKTTADKYKTKRQKQKKEQTMPELKQPERPGTKKANVKAGTKDPSKQPELKQQKNKAKSKLVNPKKQPKLKQHKIKKY